MAEWLGTGLQNRLRRFESARNLNISSKVVENQYFRAFWFFRGREWGRRISKIQKSDNQKGENITTVISSIPFSKVLSKFYSGQSWESFLKRFYNDLPIDMLILHYLMDIEYVIWKRLFIWLKKYDILIIGDMYLYIIFL